jgi:hypothetical protein
MTVSKSSVPRIATHLRREMGAVCDRLRGGNQGLVNAAIKRTLSKRTSRCLDGDDGSADFEIFDQRVEGLTERWCGRANARIMKFFSRIHFRR